MINETQEEHNSNIQIPYKPRILPNILVTGVPGTGKTTLSMLLVDQLNTTLNQNLGTQKNYYEHFNVGKKNLVTFRRNYKRK